MATVRPVLVAVLMFQVNTASAQVSPPDTAGASGKVLEVGYFVGTGRSADSFRPADRELATWAIQAWQRTIGPSIRFVPVGEEGALLRVNWVGPLSGQYGEMRPLVVGGRRGGAVYIRPDIASLGPDIAERAQSDRLFRDTIVYLTCVHELGHAIGLPHTSDFRDIMYSFGYGGDIVAYFARYRTQLRQRADIASVAGLSDDDVRAIRERFRVR